MESFSLEELNQIFSGFKETTLKFLEEDIRWTGKKEQSPPKVARAERGEAERRYA